MIVARPGEQFEARVEGFPTGLAGTVGYRILDDTGHEANGRTTAAIAENPAGSGSYIANPNAPAETGSYSVMWDTGVVSPSTTAFEQLTVIGAAASGATVLSDGSLVTVGGSYRPTLADVAARVPSRAKSRYSGRLATFDDTTQPTGDQVQAIIDEEIAALAGKIGTPPDALLDSAKRIATLRAAAMVELSYFGDQIQAGRSPYTELKALYEEAVSDYLADRGQLGGDEEAGTADDQAPVYSFPPLSGTANGFWTVNTPDAEQPLDPTQGPVW